MYRKLKSPMNVQFEITSKCNEKCRHCYNYWRRDSCPDNTANMSRETFEACLSELIKNNVLHVIFTGGEPFFNFETLVHGIRRATEEGLSTTCNSNLLLADREKLETLADAGLPHILTSLNSADPKTNDYITSHPGAFERIVASIQTAVDVGIRISTNMIITSNNIDHIVDTGMLATELGVKNFHITRVVPPSYIGEADRAEFTMGKKEQERILEQALELSEKSDIRIKTLIPFPLCALGDLDRYKQFIGRPCAAGKRAMSIDSRGNGHACWHMTKEYGNVVEQGLARVWEDMQEWRSGELVPLECKPCPYLPLCGAGCRVAGATFYGELKAPDNLRYGWESITRPYTGNIGVDDTDCSFERIAALYEASMTPELYAKVDTGSWKAASGVRIRDEEGFGVVNLMAGTGFFLEQRYVDLLRRMQSLGTFTLADLGAEYRDALAYLAVKRVVDPA